jgi:hypothetical protein
MDIAVLGIDLGKNNCSIVGLDGTGQVILRRRMQRKSIAVLGAKLSPCINCNGGLLWCPSSWPGSFNPGTHGSADVA